MDYRDFLGYEGEKPLEQLKDDGGFTAIFRTIGVIGDSLASGEFETVDAKGTVHYHDLYEYSWGQFLARAAGMKVYNFSRGGMTAKEYWESFADENDCWKDCQAYIICLGHNDLFLCGHPLGDSGDIHPEAPEQNAPTYMGYMGKILSRLKEIQPHAKIFVISPQCDGAGDEHDRIVHLCAGQLEKLALLYDGCYLLDFSRYSVAYSEEVREHFALGFHPNPMGYYVYAKMVGSYIDYIVRHNMKDFAQAGLIGTGLLEEKPKR